MLAVIASLMCGLGAISGCEMPQRVPPSALQKQLAAAEDELALLRQRTANQQQTIDEQAKQILALQQRGDKRWEKLASVAKIRFARLSGGYDADADGNDDGVVLYIQPVDVDGDVIKSAGELKVRLFDLAASAEGRLIGQYFFDGDELRKHWYGRLMTQHYTIKCPWPEGFKPERREVTVRVEFLEYLTGRTLTSQLACKISSTEPAVVDMP